MKLVGRSVARLRLMVQIIFTTLTNLNIKGFLEGNIYRGKSKMVCAPGLNCYSCPGALGACPIGSFQAVVNARQFNLSFYIGGFIMSMGAFLGRFTCGWLCPFGLYQDLLHKVPIFRKIKEVPREKYLRSLKYFVLLVFVIILPIFVTNFAGLGSPFYCKWICPSGTLIAGIPLTITNTSLRSAAGFLFSWKLAILIIITVASIKIYRPFCRYLCPLGAVYGLFNPIALYRFELDESACIDCKACERACKLNIKAYEDVNSRECIRCGDCIDACPTKAITSRFIKGKEKIKEK